MRKTKDTNPSNAPQNVSRNVWYYEDIGSLGFYINASGWTYEFSIMVKMIIKSLERMGYTVTKKK